MNLHKNMPKRIYVPGAEFAITTNTLNRYPYFNEPLICHLFLHELHACAIKHNVLIHGLKINPDHIHMIIETHGESNYTQFMFSLKKNSSQNANRILGYNSKWLKTHDLSMYNHHLIVALLRDIVLQEKGLNHSIPKFKWQHSYYLHRITDDIDFMNQLDYIKKQWIKHDLGENKWCFVEESLHTFTPSR